MLQKTLYQEELREPLLLSGSFYKETFQKIQRFLGNILTFGDMFYVFII